MKILPDGTVEITNKRTGETKVIKPEDLGSYGIKYTDYVDQAKAYQQIPGSAPLVNTPETAADKTKKTSLDAINNLIGNLENRYQEGGGAKSSIGPLSRILGLITTAGGELGLNDNAKLYSNERQGFAATLKSLTGDTGVMTDQDFARLAKLIPILGATQGEAIGGFNDLRSQVASKFGGETQQTTFNPEARKPVETGNPLTDTLKGNEILNFLLGNSLSAANDVGMGIKSRRVMPDISNLESNVSDLMQSASKTTDPQQREQLLKEAGIANDTTLDLAQGLNKGYSQENNQSPLMRGLLTGTEVASTAEIPSALKGIFNAAKKLPSGVKNLGGKVFSQGAGKELRNTAVETAEQAGKKVEGSTITNAVEKWAGDAKRANPQAIKSIDKYVEGIKSQIGDKVLSPKETFQLWDDASKGFSAAGTKGASLQASYHRAVRDVVRKELESVAPGFEKGTQLIRQGLGRTDTAKGVAKIAGSTAVGGLTSLLLYKLLFGGKGGQ